jgi:aspartate/methionine/tyrosine aminotransferase
MKRPKFSSDSLYGNVINQENLTQYEHIAINREFNLADAHAHQFQSPEQQQIIEELPKLFNYAEITPQSIIERDFLYSFFELAGQDEAKRKNNNSLLCYSASMAIEIIAYYLKQTKKKVGLIQPTFDNLPQILWHAEVNAIPIPENKIFIDMDLDYLSALDLDAIFIVNPNNPTGRWLTRSSFEKLAEFCAANKITLISDFCFRFFQDEMYWDQYKVAKDNNIDFLFIEDTGKTWPALDLKAGILTSNERIFSEVFKIHNALMLNVSSFTLELLRRYITLSMEHGISSTVTNIVKANRTYLRKAISDFPIYLENQNSQISVEWLKLNRGDKMELINLSTETEKRDIHILPGEYFFWKNPSIGKSYFRLALMRDPGLFQAATDSLKDLFAELFASIQV